jgi:putative addiction module killer protein
LRIATGSGYRVYFGQDGETIVILLCGGDKSSQNRDIEKAKIYWQDYRRNN